MSVEPTQKRINNFFAILNTGDVRRIALTQDVTDSIQKVFVDAGALFESEELDQVPFDGNYRTEDEEILFVNMRLDDRILETQNNSIGIPILNFPKELIKTLFWTEKGVYYFQNFDTRKMLVNRNIIVFNKDTFTALKQDAFIVDNIVNAIYKDGKFLFFSYANANKIFNLSDFYVEATNKDLEEFSEHSKVVIPDIAWFINSSRSGIRKNVTLLKKSKVLDSLDCKKMKKDAKKFNLTIDLDEDGRIVFPRKKKDVRDILIYLNEQFYEGMITGNKYRTNSKRNVKLAQLS